MKQSYRPAIGIRILCVLLSLVLYAGVVAAIFVADVQTVTSKDNLQKIISQALFTTHTVRPVPGVTGGSGAPAHTPRIGSAKLSDIEIEIDSEDLEQMLEGSDIDTEALGETSQQLVEWVYNSLMSEYGDQVSISREDVQAFVEESTLKDFVAEMGASLISDFYTGENTTTLDAETIRGLLEENASLIEKHFGYTLDAEVIDAVASAISENDLVAKIQEEGVTSILTGSISGETTGENSETNALVTTVTEILETFRSATSQQTLITCIIVAAVCAAVIILLNLKYIWYALRKIGNTLIVSDILYLIPVVLALLLTETWNNLFSFAPPVGKVVYTVVELTAPVAIGVFAAGVVLDIAALIIRLSVKKARANAAETQDLSQALEAEIPEATAKSEEPGLDELSELLSQVETLVSEETPTQEETPAETL